MASCGSNVLEKVKDDDLKNKTISYLASEKNGLIREQQRIATGDKEATAKP